jgi:transcriptional regulator with XRE-family HTH domain
LEQSGARAFSFVLAPPWVRGLMTYLELARRKLGLSQRQLGHDPRVRIHQTLISMLERGEVLPGPDQRRRLAAALSVPEELLTEEVEVPSNSVPVVAEPV